MRFVAAAYSPDATPQAEPAVRELACFNGGNELQVSKAEKNMEQYFIIGGDGKQYGPVTEDDLRKWIAEGRLNASSTAKAESDAEWRTLDTFPEFAAALGTERPPDAAPADAQDWPDRDYELDIVGCISRGWEILKGNFGVLFVAFLVWLGVVFGFYVVAGGVTGVINAVHKLGVGGARQTVNLIISLVSALVMGPITGGLYISFLKAIRGQAVTVGNVFDGFKSSFKQLFLGYLVMAFLIGLCMVPCEIVFAAKAGPLFDQLQQAKDQSDTAQIQKLAPEFWKALVGTLPLWLLCVIPVTYLTVNWTFTLPLIMDKQLAFWPAMRASWRKVHQHWLHVFGLIVLIGLLNLAGMAACCFGALFTAPVGMAAIMIAYETIFGRQKTN